MSNLVLCERDDVVSIADNIRAVNGETSSYTLAQMSSEVSDINSEVATQAELLEDIAAALEGKAGGGSGSLETCTVTLNGIWPYVAYTTVEDGSIKYVYSNSSITSIEVVCGTVIVCSNGSAAMPSCSISGGITLQTRFFGNYGVHLYTATSDGSLTIVDDGNTSS